MEGLGKGVTLQLYGINHQALFWLVQASVTVQQPPGQALRGFADERAPSMAIAGSNPAMAILDSGTSLITAPGAAYVGVVQALVAGLPGATEKCTTTLLGAFGQLMCLCDVELNPISFTLTGQGGRRLRLTLAAKDLMQLVGVGSNGQSVCRIAIMPSPVQVPLWILGDTFLRHVYAVHDVSGHKVQLFPQRGSQAAAILEPEEPTSMDAVRLGASFLFAAVLFALVALSATAVFYRRPLADASYMRL